MPVTNKILPHYTYEDWKLWEGKWELFGGHPVAMSPTAIPRHQYVASSLRGEFYQVLKKCPKCKVYDPLDYKINEDLILIPDILIVCKPLIKKFLDFPPILVVEILSPSTALRDRNTKFDIYEQEGVKYYLIVDADKNSLEIYKLVGGKYHLQSMVDNKYNFDFDEENCKIEVDFNDIW